MSGGELVVLDAHGRATKQFALAGGMATLGRDHRCDIRVMKPSVALHHATIVVHANQTVVQNLSEEEETLVNGSPVSVAALCHGDVITIGDRQLRWEYYRPNAVRPTQPPGPAVVCIRGGSRPKRPSRRTTAAPDLTPPQRAALTAHHRASMPGSAGGKQVAIVQPQRRDNNEQQDNSVGAVPSPTRATRQSQSGVSPRAVARHRHRHSHTHTHTTKATLWIESRKSTPRKLPRARVSVAPGRSCVPARRKSTPLRLSAMRRAHTQRRAAVAKISPPHTVDHTKQAAILLMTRHTPKCGPPARPTPAHYTTAARKTFKRSANNDSVVEINDSEVQGSMVGDNSNSLRQSDQNSSLHMQTPMKSAMKDPKKSARKTESIKFDLSNLENHDMVTLRDSIQNSDEDDENLTLHYSDSSSPPSPKSPSPQKSIHSRSARMLEQIGTPVPEVKTSTCIVMNPESPSARKSLRGSLIIKKALGETTSESQNASSSRTYTDHSLDTTIESAFRTRTITPNTKRKLESYSIVDLVSADSNATDSSMYDSVGSTRSSSILFGTPRTSVGRKTRSRSTISSANMVGSSTPYVTEIRRVGRSTSSPNLQASPDRSAKNLRRSKSLTTPENSQPHISVNSTRISRVSRSRSRINDSDLQYISSRLDDDNDSPKSSRRSSRPDKSLASSSNVSKRSINNQESVETTQGTLDNDVTMSSVKSKSNFSKRSPRSQSGFDTLNSIIENDATISPENSKTNLSKRGSRSQTDLDVSESILVNNQSPRSLTSKSRNDVTIDIDNSKSNALKRSSRKTGSDISKSVLENNQSPRSASKSVLSKRGSKTQNSFDIANSILENVWSPRSEKSPKINTSPRGSRKQSSFDATKSILDKDNSRRSSRISPKNINVTFGSVKSASKRSTRSLQKSLETSPTDVDDDVIFNPNSSNSSKSSPNKTSTPRKSVNSAENSQVMTSPDGTITPENRTSPKDDGTPVLCIQKLLDSSINSLSPSQKRLAGSKRKTIGTLHPRSGKRSLGISKSLTFSRRSLRSINEASSNSSSTNVTPKSTVQTLKDDVKHKHSTAKKPVSKRSLIDTLNESDIVKQLFNSPVKRKLSQSMTEFSRKKLFDDDEFLPKRQTRNTIAVTDQVQDDSILDHSEQYTPEQFVSPIVSAESSPSLTGVKDLFKKNTPKNNLSDLRGVRNLLKTPKTRASLRNDLTRVSGVKRLFTKTQPRNDLRNVSGVKSLFQTQNNDLSDVRGVKKLFQRKSAHNDLRNISGVKKTLQKRSPRNDLTDVRGVKRLFGREKTQNELEISGVKELFNESRVKDPEALFDELIGKPPIKKVYSKSFLEKAKKKVNSAMSKSLNVPIDVITYHVEDWIQEELQKRFNKKRNETLSGSAPKATGELNKLVTDTIEGSSPLCDSRVRKSTLMKVNDDSGKKKSVSALYSPRKLPIKKRSLVEVSVAKIGEASARKRRLPIKKRNTAVVHSTPVKGRNNTTINVSELSRVSPITSFGTTQREVQAELTNIEKSSIATPVTVEVEKQPQVNKKRPASRGRQKKNLQMSTDNKIQEQIQEPTDDNAKPDRVQSPKAKLAETQSKSSEKLIENKTDDVTLNENKKTRQTRKNAGKRQTKNITPKRVTRAKAVANKASTESVKNKVQEETSISSLKRTVRTKPSSELLNTKKSKNSLIIIKKSPVISTSKSRFSTSSSEHKENRRVVTRRQKTETVANVIIPATPNLLRTRVTAKSTLAIGKPIPNLQVRGRKAKIAEVIKENKPATRTRKAEPKIADAKEAKGEPARRGRKNGKIPEATKETDSVSDKRSGKTAKEAETVENKLEPKRSRRKVQEIENVVEVKAEPLKRGRKNEKVAEQETIIEVAPRTRKTNKVQEDKPEQVKRGRKVVTQEESKPEPVRRGRRAEKVVEELKPEPARKGRQANKVELVSDKPNDEPASKNKKTEKVQEQNVAEPVKRGRKATQEVKPEPIRSTRNTKMVPEVPNTVPTRRGRKTERNEEDNKAEPGRGGRNTRNVLEITHEPNPRAVRRRNNEKSTEEAEATEAIPAKRSKIDLAKSKKEVATMETQTSAPSIVRIEKQIASEREEAETKLQKAVRGGRKIVKEPPKEPEEMGKGKRTRKGIKEAYATTKKLRNSKGVAGGGDSKRSRGRKAVRAASSRHDSGCVLSDTTRNQGEAESSSSKSDAEKPPRSRKGSAKNTIELAEPPDAPRSVSEGSTRSRKRKIDRSPVYKQVPKRARAVPTNSTRRTEAVAAGGRSRR